MANISCCLLLRRLRNLRTMPFTWSVGFLCVSGDPYFNSLSIKMVSPSPPLCAGKPDAFVKAKADRMYESIDEKG
jgi:hypothetical protein